MSINAEDRMQYNLTNKFVVIPPLPFPDDPPVPGYAQSQRTKPGDYRSKQGASQLSISRYRV